MRVRGSRKRVHLTEVDLEPLEQRPMLRVAPAAASMIWLGSIALATAIYMEWLPARALFSDQRTARSERSRTGGDRGERDPRAPRVHPTARARATPPAVAPAATAPGATVTRAEPPIVASEGAEPLPHESTISTPSVVPESSRTIRGSYHSEDSNWAGGW
jgi:hypothetical protein